MRKRNGFTLVELLITIAIMLSLLGIAMVSFINISNSKKRESWSGVKEQIKTAAEQYFSSNEYLINDIKNGGYAFVSVGTLVKNDYLNRVINPESGKTIDRCDIVVVTKRESEIGYDYKYCQGVGDDECEVKSDMDAQKNDSCDNYSGNKNPEEPKEEPVKTTTTQPAGCPKFTYTSKAEPKNGWYDDDVIVTADDDAKTRCTLTQTGTCQSKSNSKCSSETVYIDKSTPSISINAYQNPGDSVTSSNGLNRYSGTGAWYNKYAFVNITFSPGTSGVKSKVCTDVRSDGKHDNIGDWRNVRTEGTTTISCKLITNSGKTATASYVIKLDRTAPTCSVSLNGTTGNKVSNLQWYKSDVTLTGTCKDTLSGCKRSSITLPKSTEQRYANLSPGTVYDNAGNAKKCGGITFGIDKTAPQITHQKNEAYDGDNSYCGKANGARTEYTVEDKVSGIQNVHDYYTTNNNDDHLTNIGKWRVAGREVKYNNGVSSHFSNIEQRAVNSVLSKVSYKDIWTKSGKCRSGSGIGTGTYYHKERACDVAGNCATSKTSGIRVN